MIVRCTSLVPPAMRPAGAAVSARAEVALEEGGGTVEVGGQDGGIEAQLTHAQLGQRGRGRSLRTLAFEQGQQRPAPPVELRRALAANGVGRRPVLNPGRLGPARARCTGGQPPQAALEADGPGHHRTALVGERGHAHPPSVTQRADQSRRRHPYIGEDDLIEMCLAGHLPQRPHLDAGEAHVEQEERDPPVARNVGIGAGHEDAPVGHPPVRAPHLLTVDHEIVTVGHGRSAQ